jgi:small subunit ribosomal protein S9
MTDDERDTSPAGEEPEGQAADEEPAAQATPEDEQPAAEAERPAEEEAAEEAPAGEEAAAAEEAPAAEEEPAAKESGAEPRESKEPEPPPGAELEPLTLDEPELGAEERARLEAEAEERARLEAAATAEAEEEPAARGKRDVKLPEDVRVQATGKRKSAIARVLVRPGQGGFEVNQRELVEYFPRPLHQSVARQALVASGYESAVDVRVRVHGGGVSGQADAIRHGVARALTEIDPELRPELKRRGFLSRDARVKERRKAGLKKARKRPQFSKR